MKIVTCIQGTAEWLAIRSGRVTASKVAAVLNFLKRGGESAERAAYRVQLAAEILTGQCAGEGFVSDYMRWGAENEPYARAAYEVRHDASVDTVGFVIHPTIERAGGSPDGLVGDDGMVELKCPKTSTHIEYMLAGVVPPEYEPQVMFGLACTERAWCDFSSFDSRLPLRHQLFTVRVYRDEARIKTIEDCVRDFLGEVDGLIAKLDGMNPLAEQLRASVDIEDGLGITDDDIRAVDGAWRGDAVAAQIAAADSRMRELVGGE
jgi:putative phage-type endonuclease